MDERRKMQLESVVAEASALGKLGREEPVARLAKQVEQLAKLLLELERENDSSARVF